MESTMEVVTVPTLQALYHVRNIRMLQADAEGRERVLFSKQAPQSQLLAQRSVFLNTTLRRLRDPPGLAHLCYVAEMPSFRQSPSSGCSNPSQAIF